VEYNNGIDDVVGLR